MSALRAACVALLLAASACVAPLSAPPAHTPPAPRAGPVAPIASVEREVHALVNQHRARVRLPALQYDERIATIARQHSEAMAARRRPFSHEGFQERGNAILAFIPYHGLAENVAYDSRSGASLPSLIVSGWLASAAHLENIQGSYDLTGIGIARSPEGVTYATQIFVKR